MMIRICSLVLALSVVLAGAASAQPNEYIVGSQDVLTVTVYDQADLTGKYPVDADGTLTFPLIGRVKVGGLSLHGVEAELKKELANGYLKNPQVTVAGVALLFAARGAGPTFLEFVAHAGIE